MNGFPKAKGEFPPIGCSTSFKLLALKLFPGEGSSTVAVYNYAGYDDNQVVFPGGSPNTGETISFSGPSNHVIQITDNDSWLHDGTDDRDDEDSNQTAVVLDEFGTAEMSGQIQPRERVVLQNGGDSHVMHRVYFASSNAYYYIFEDPPPSTGITYTVTSVSTPNKTLYSSFSTEGVTCFLRGTPIAVPGGWQPVEAIRFGDRVLTLDCGAQPVQAVRMRSVSGPDMQRMRGLRAFSVAPDCFGMGHPRRPVFLSRQHRILIDNCGSPAFAAVHALAALGWIEERALPFGAEFVHLALERHHIIFADGLACETLLRTPRSCPGGVAAPMDPARAIISNSRARSLALLPGAFGPKARLSPNVPGIFSGIVSGAGPEGLDQKSDSLRATSIAK